MIPALFVVQPDIWRLAARRAALHARVFLHTRSGGLLAHVARGPCETRWPLVLRRIRMTGTGGSSTSETSCRGFGRRRTQSAVRVPESTTARGAGAHIRSVLPDARIVLLSHGLSTDYLHEMRAVSGGPSPDAGWIRRCRSGAARRNHGLAPLLSHVLCLSELDQASGTGWARGERP